MRCYQRCSRPAHPPLARHQPLVQRREPSAAERASAGLGRSLQFELFRPGQVNVKQYYAELPIAVRVTGSYHDIGLFAADVANLSRIVTLNNIVLTPLAGRPGMLTMDCTAKTFRYLDPDEISAQSKAQGAKK
ncbi:MAG: type 4a pilus biogenesis protein PilO [Phycisphaerales bacterium]|nr:type 4a pilus biogenesis protein PilO [Phycisphaerales bacterium]